jgi:Fe(3+) dicitrate transport protein
MKAIQLILLLMILSSTAYAAEIVVRGKVVSKDDGSPVPGVQIFIENSNRMALSEADGSYKITGLRPGDYTIVAFSQGLDTQKRRIEVVEGEYVVNFSLPEISKEIEAVTIKEEYVKTEGITRLKAVDGFGIYESKKNEVIVLDDMLANKASNNPRQVFAKVAGLNIWESDCAGLQIGVGSRGLSPNRNSNFNTRQNGHDISADALGYPESYYSPALQAVERIEIIRGAASLQYGTQFGGLVNFVMKEGPEDKKIEFNTEQTGNSLGFYSGFNSVGGTVGKVSYYAYNRYAAGECGRCNSEFESNTSYAQVKFKPTDDLSIKLNYTNMYYLAQQPGGLTDALFISDPRQSIRERNWFSVDWNLMALDIDYRISQKLKVNTRSFALIGGRDALGNLGRIDRIDNNEERDLFVDDFKNFGNETRLILNYNAFNQPAVALFGARVYHGLTKRRQGNGSAGIDPDFSFNNPQNLEGSSFDFPGSNISFFAENIFNLLPKLSVTPGIRYEYINTKANGYYQNTTLVKDPETGMAVDSVYKVFEKKERPRDFMFFGIGASYNYSPDVELYTNFSQNYRSINFNDVRVVNPNLTVDENIRDESGYNFDIGIRGGKRGFFNYDISAFYLKYNDRIGSVLRADPVSYRIYRFRTNISDSRNIGLEAFGEINLLPLLSKDNNSTLNVFANLSLIDARYISSEEKAINNNAVELVPPLSIKTGVSYSKGKFKVSYQFSYTHEHYTDASNVVFTPSAIEGIIPSYYVMDLGASWEVNKYFGIQAGVNNLTNNDYFTRRATGYPGPGIIPADGRSVYLTLKGRI